MCFVIIWFFFFFSGGGGNFVLSSSTTGYTPLVGGVAAMVQDGYGCFYNMLPDKLVISSVLTSFIYYLKL